MSTTSEPFLPVELLVDNRSVIFRGKWDGQQLPQPEYPNEAWLWLGNLWCISPLGSWTEVFAATGPSEHTAEISGWNLQEEIFDEALPPASNYKDDDAVIFRNEFWVIHEGAWVNGGSLSMVFSNDKVSAVIHPENNMPVWEGPELPPVANYSEHNAINWNDEFWLVFR